MLVTQRKVEIRAVVTKFSFGQVQFCSIQGPLKARNRNNINCIYVDVY